MRRLIRRREAEWNSGEILGGRWFGEERCRLVSSSYETITADDQKIAYVQTQVQNPLLSLTASVTLREQPGHVRTHCKGGLSLDAASIRSGTETVRTDGTEYDGHDDSEEDDLAGMEVIDLLGGLAGGTLAKLIMSQLMALQETRQCQRPA